MLLRVVFEDIDGLGFNFRMFSVCGMVVGVAFSEFMFFGFRNLGFNVLDMRNLEVNALRRAPELRVSNDRVVAGSRSWCRFPFLGRRI